MQVTVKGETLSYQQLTEALATPTCPLRRPMTELRSALLNDPALKGRLIGEITRLMHTISGLVLLAKTTAQPRDESSSSAKVTLVASGRIHP